MDRWCEIIAEKIDKTRPQTSYGESSDRAIFSSGSSEDDEDRPSKRLSQGVKDPEPVPPNGSIVVEEFLPPSFSTQTKPVPVASDFEGRIFHISPTKILNHNLVISISLFFRQSSARPLVDTDSVFEIDLDSVRARLEDDFHSIENMFDDLLQPLEDFPALTSKPQQTQPAVVTLAPIPAFTSAPTPAPVSPKLALPTPIAQHVWVEPTVSQAPKANPAADIQLLSQSLNNLDQVAKARDDGNLPLFSLALCSVLKCFLD